METHLQVSSHLLGRQVCKKAEPLLEIFFNINQISAIIKCFYLLLYIIIIIVFKCLFFMMWSGILTFPAHINSFLCPSGRGAWQTSVSAHEILVLIIFEHLKVSEFHHNHRPTHETQNNNSKNYTNMEAS